MPLACRIWNLITRFTADRGGQVALIFALALVPIIGAAGVAVDYSRANSVRSQLQAALDAAVLAGAADQTSNQTTTASNNFSANLSIGGTSGVTYGTPSFSAQSGKFTGTASATVPMTFAGVLGFKTMAVSAYAAATPSDIASNGNAMCLLALNATVQAAVNDSGGTKVNAPNCITQINSSNTKAVSLSGGAQINSAENCFVGGMSSSGGSSVSPSPDVVCKAKADPFATYATPTVGPCDYTNYKTSTPATLQPGVYCGGISISSTTVTFSPGLYIINGGLVQSSGSSVVSGDGVSFYLTGTGAGVSTSGGSGWHIVAMSSGTLAGFVFFLDPAANAASKSGLSGSSQLYFEGVIYLPNQQLTLSGQSTAYTPSPFTAYIADTFTLSGSAALTIYSDPTKTSVPVPSALLSGSGGEKIHLTN